jgi:very-short-patch-repair endonuclease
VTIWPRTSGKRGIVGGAPCRSAFEPDRARDQIHVAHGYRVIRVTWRQFEHSPLAVLVRIAQALAFGAA